MIIKLKKLTAGVGVIGAGLLRWMNIGSPGYHISPSPCPHSSLTLSAHSFSTPSPLHLIAAFLPHLPPTFFHPHLAPTFLAHLGPIWIISDIRTSIQVGCEVHNM